MFDFRPFNTTRFEITRGKDTRAFERVKGTGETRSTHGSRSRLPTKTVDSSNFEGALLDFSNLRAESFVARAGAATGHNKPAAVIVVKFDDGKKEERVTFGTAGRGRVRHARRSAGRAEDRSRQVRRRRSKSSTPFSKMRA